MITGVHHRGPGGERSRALVVMLAGVGIEASEFSERGLVGVLHERNPSVDVIATRPDLDLYLDGNLAAALHRDVVDPARMQGYARLWMLGISLGGMGALHYASIHPVEIEGLILLAPFLGTQGTVAEISATGGLAAWSAANSMSTAVERRVPPMAEGLSRPAAEASSALSGLWLRRPFRRGASDARRTDALGACGDHGRGS